MKTRATLERAFGKDDQGLAGAQTIGELSGVGNAALWIEALDEGGAERAEEEAGKLGVYQLTLGDKGEVRWKDSREGETVEVALLIGDEDAAATARQLLQTLNTWEEPSRSKEEPRSSTKRSSAVRCPSGNDHAEPDDGCDDRNEQAGTNGVESCFGACRNRLNSGMTLACISPKNCWARAGAVRSVCPFS